MFTFLVFKVVFFLYINIFFLMNILLVKWNRVFEHVFFVNKKYSEVYNKIEVLLNKDNNKEFIMKKDKKSWHSVSHLLLINEIEILNRDRDLIRRFF